MTLSTSRDVVLAPSLVVLLRQVEERIRRELQPTLTDAALSPEHWRIMAVLLARPGQRMTAIGEAAVLPSASMTRHVDRLVERGLLVRRVDPDDRRSAVVALSPQGRELATRIRALEEAVEARVSAEIGEERLQELLRVLTAL